MATRYYPTRKAPNAIIRGPLNGTWNQGDVLSRSDIWAYRLSTVKTTDGGLNYNVNFWSNQQGNYDFPFSWRWVTYPLQAQTISGTFNLCFGVTQWWDTVSVGASNNSVIRFKVHIYIAQGQSTTPRAILLNNYVDSVDWNYLNIKYQTLVSAQTLASAAALAGDIIVVEIGCRIVSSPTPTPTYPPGANTTMRLYSVGADPAKPDAIPNDTSGSTAFDSWLEFSGTILEQAAPTPPANDACADAIVISSIPYTSSYIDSTQSADVKRAVWWTFTAPTTGMLHITAHGTNHQAEFNVYTGNCGALSTVSSLHSDGMLSAHRSQAFIQLPVTAGVQYWIKVSDTFNGGGLTRINVFYQPTVYQDDDLFIANGAIHVFRGSQRLNHGGSWGGYPTTGIGIDYTKRPINTIQSAINSEERLLLALHDYELVEIAEMFDINKEIDFIGDAWGGNPDHPAQIHVTQAGMIHVGWFGDGYLYTSGSGNKPAYLNTVSSASDHSSLRSIDSIKGDFQEVGGIFFTDIERVIGIEVVAGWAIALNESTGVLYYTSGGTYIPVGGQVIKRYNINTNTQLADFATLTLSGTKNPGLKGLALLPDGGLLVCNGTVVNRLNAAGAVTQTYTPSISMDSQTLVDAVLSKDGTKFWTIDLWTTRVFQFDVASGAELLTFQIYGTPGSVVQMVAYGASVPIPPDISGIYYVNPKKITNHDSYYNDVEKKIPNPTVRTALVGE